jgi:3-phenylpropionate/cinnamic acid dioxygenase small subunit
MARPSRTTSRKGSPAKSRARKAARRVKAAARKKAAPKKASRKNATRKKAAKRKTAARKAALPARAFRAAGPRLSDTFMLRLEIEELHAAYAYCLDHGRIEEWPDFFTDDCIYKLISRENYDLGLPLGTMFAEKRGGLLDRVASVKKTTVYHERYLTHLISNTRVLSQKRGAIEASANYVVLETLPNQYTQILNAGRYLDTIVRDGGHLRFREKICVFDTVLVPASIIHPV